MTLNTQLVDTFLEKNAKKHLFNPARPKDVMTQMYFFVFLLPLFFIPYILFHKRYYYRDIYSQGRFPDIANQKREITKILEITGGELQEAEEVLYAIIPPTAFSTYGIVITNARLFYALKYDKSIMKSGKSDVTGIKKLSEIGRPLISKKSLAGDVNIKLGNDLIGCLIDVDSPRYVENFLVQVYEATERE